MSTEDDCGHHDTEGDKTKQTQDANLCVEFEERCESQCVRTRRILRGNFLEAIRTGIAEHDGDISRVLAQDKHGDQNAEKDTT